MDESVSAAEANRQFSRILRGVKGGRTYVVTSHGAAVARIVPAGRDGAVAAAARQALIGRLRARPTQLVAGPWRRDDLYDER